MIGKEVKEVGPVTLSEVYDIMKKRLKDAEKQREEDKKAGIAHTITIKPESEDAEPIVEEKPLMGLEQRGTLDYSKKFAHLSKKKSSEMMDELMKIGKMKPEVAVKVVDLLSDNKDRLKLLFSKEHVAVTEKDLDEVVKIVEKYKK